MKEVTAYACSYCEKIYKNKSSAVSHEKKCFANPARRACRTCKHAIKDTETIYVRPQGDQNYGDADYEIDYIYCETTEKILSHPEKPCGFKWNCPYYQEGERLF